ncbi:MAG: 4-alpha-glucanotransferase [Chlamydiae bacterium]|nr:4-alpha-glucanotransferase [Chlamydiota bacterium]
MNEELEHQLFSTPAGSQWKKIGARNHHGICVPLFSLHTEQSTGVGEYLDLIPLIGWCHEVGMDVIQLLPLNDTGLGSSPYSAISATALNPVHLSLSQLPDIDKIAHYREKLAQMRYWNSTSRVKYNIVRELKNSFLRDYFAHFFSEVSESTEYKNFLLHNKWLKPYALFKAIKEQQEWRPWEEWPLPLKSPSETGYQDLLVEFGNSIHFHEFSQYFCFSQLEKVKKTAEDANILLKGDIPILISRDSADVWHHRHYFLLHLSAGAPPDMYTRDGQHWGFPVYDWEELEKDDFSWWHERLELASRLYHLYRIDHIVGFFRLWAIASGKIAKEGSFIPPEEDQWIPHGRKIMKMMLRSAPILPIGEDLGLVPPEVKKCLTELGICGTRMMRWERRWETDGKFTPPSEYPPASMTTVSTHDSDTLQLWWRHFPKEARLYSEFKEWPYKPFLSNESLQEILRDSHHSGSLFHINLLQEYLALYPELISHNPADERINIPGKILARNWTYRFRPTVEELVKHIPLKEAVKKILQ